MFVARETFQPMLAAARTLEIEGVEVLVPSLEHLVAMKLHALKTAPSGREARDLQDVLGLLRSAGKDPSSDDVRHLSSAVARWRPMTGYEEPGRPVEQHAPLEFPDWSGMISEPRHVAFEAIYLRSLAAMPAERAKPDFELRRLASKSRVEFVL